MGFYLEKAICGISTLWNFEHVGFWTMNQILYGFNSRKKRPCIWSQNWSCPSGFNKLGIYGQVEYDTRPLNNYFEVIKFSVIWATEKNTNWIHWLQSLRLSPSIYMNINLSLRSLCGTSLRFILLFFCCCYFCWSNKFIICIFKLFFFAQSLWKLIEKKMKCHFICLCFIILLLNSLKLHKSCK